MPDQVYRFGIIGFGIAGQILTLELLKNSVPPSDICIYDETFMGGSLTTHYGTVLSNTPWWKTRKALEEYPLWNDEVLKETDTLYEKDSCMPVRDIARSCLEVAKKASTSVAKQVTRVTEIKQLDSGDLEVHHTFGISICKQLFLTHGSEPKLLNIPHTHIPLSIALDKEQLKHQVDPQKDTVTVFGTSHSGTILLKHLHELGISTNAVYKGSKPFIFARDGEYDGIKEGSEVIADTILKGSYTSLTLIPWSDPLELHKALLKTTKCIVSIGFKPIRIQGITSTTYDSSTAELHAMKNVYGFGIAYPGTTELNGRTYFDVSVLSFQAQIRKCIPAILNTSNDSLKN